jgi:hypothetical protein
MAAGGGTLGPQTSTTPGGVLAHDRDGDSPGRVAILLKDEAVMERPGRCADDRHRPAIVRGESVLRGSKLTARRVQPPGIAVGEAGSQHDSAQGGSGRLTGGCGRVTSNGVAELNRTGSDGDSLPWRKMESWHSNQSSDDHLAEASSSGGIRRR